MSLKQEMKRKRDELIIEMWRQNLTLKEIADKTGYTFQRVSQILRENNKFSR